VCTVQYSTVLLCAHSLLGVLSRLYHHEGFIYIITIPSFALLNSLLFSLHSSSSYSVQVRFVQYGITNIITTSDLLQPVPYFVHFPLLATLFCCLTVCTIQYITVLIISSVLLVCTTIFEPSRSRFQPYRARFTLHPDDRSRDDPTIESPTSKLRLQLKLTATRDLGKGIVSNHHQATNHQPPPRTTRKPPEKHQKNTRKTPNTIITTPANHHNPPKASQSLLTSTTGARRFPQGSIDTSIPFISSKQNTLRSCFKTRIIQYIITPSPAAHPGLPQFSHPAKCLSVVSWP
jgi:hypothetical protein